MPAIGFVRQTMPMSLDGLGPAGRSYTADLNFGSYLLATSPPVSFGLGYTDSEIQPDCNGNQMQKCWEKISQHAFRDPRDIEEDWARRKREISPSQRERKLSCLKPPSHAHLNGRKDWCPRSCLKSQSLIEERLPTERKSVTLPPQIKRVQFADDIGRKLFVVKFFEEMPDVPSYITPFCVQRNNRNSRPTATSCPDLTRVVPPPPQTPQSTKDEVKQRATTGNSKVILVPNFSMPAASYMSFRQKIEHDCVSLESVHQSETSGELCGTIKVKEITFEKTVFVRCTFNNWHTFTDTNADYVQPKTPHVGFRPVPYATFAFQIELPNYTGIIKGAQMVVCYRTDGKEYWDNNGGCNYELVSPDWLESEGVNRDELCGERNTTGPAVFSAKPSDNWSTYTSWSDLDTSSPYY